MVGIVDEVVLHECEALGGTDCAYSYSEDFFLYDRVLAALSAEGVRGTEEKRIIYSECSWRAS